ncbi:MAG: carbamoyltransferase HypF [Actinomycetota bacterium]|nr:carbamoyltransferase HypF [Actinomycetota bacterium]
MSLATRAPAAPAQRRRFRITGVVQGVGFRPYVHRLATELGLTGFVGNDELAVFLEVQGGPAEIAEFTARLPLETPPLAVVTSVLAEPLALTSEEGFTVVASRSGAGAARTLVPPDVATCDACLSELFDEGDRRYRHPFITCTDCGPRFTIIQDLPYDRPATTMAAFPMCDACAREYSSPADRRFHAQPVACPDCGPVLWFERGHSRVDGADAALAAAQQALRDGQIVAVKGVGGFHLACRADDPAAVARLRQRKAREQKPFALLARDLAAAGRLAWIEPDEQTVLTCPARPIVLMRRRADAPITDSVAPGNPLLGVMLPSSPLHHLLLARVPGADVDPPQVLVMTSANISDEPLCFDDVDVATRLPGLADAVLTHDRPIHVACDDSVVRVVDGQELPIRRSRGYAPLPVRLVPGLPVTLAVGAELKNTCCLIDGANAFCSAHVGDMGSLDTRRAFERAVTQLTTLHQVQPQVLAADAHPSYLTRVWAEQHSGGPGEPELLLVQHHHAHVASLLAEHGRIGQPIIGVAFDGTGFGDDGTIWGGEFLLLGDDITRYRRASHLQTVGLPGGDAAVRNPCRMALAYLDAAGVPWDDALAPIQASTPAERAAVRAQLDSAAGTVQCSSMGRLFDAVASLLDVRHRIGYEAQAAIQLELLAARGHRADAPELRFGLDDHGVLDYRPVVRGLVEGTRAGVAPAHLARAFHAAVTEAVTGAVARIAAESGVRLVGLTGGVFQNVLLLRACRDRLAADGFDVLVHRLVPPNDGGIALGQAVVAAHRAVRRAGEDTP